ncbi:hypothetical protein GQ600_27712 [Phytophthora cactorum]|nr:hypothetical protein GQ600_27712 [Phytophthora cactorum]
MENSRLEPPVSAVQQQKLREAYNSPMRPSQYMRTPEDAEKAKETPCEAAARRERERVSMEQVLLDRRWVFHCASPLFHFHHDQLSEYAHDLVKTLRAAALRACGLQFGYSVSIRNTNAFVAFQIREERDRRCSRENKDVRPERSGGFVLYFPTDVEQRAPRKGRERQQVLLLRGDEELLRWVCSWLQRRFQCVVSTYVVHIQQLNLKRLARNWAVASLLAEGARRPSVVKTRKKTSLWPHKNRREHLFCSSTVRRKKRNQLIELVERLYIDSLPFDLSTYEIERVEMQEVAVDLDGGVELYSMDLVHTVLFSLLELLAVQNVATTSRPETTL